jgi:hypothetical protein
MAVSVREASLAQSARHTHVFAALQCAILTRLGGWDANIDRIGGGGERGYPATSLHRCRRSCRRCIRALRPRYGRRRARFEPRTACVPLSHRPLGLRTHALGYDELRTGVRRQLQDAIVAGHAPK